MSSNDNAKVSDSGYTNTCDNSQSRKSSGSSLSRNSNQSESSGYCGHPSKFGFRNEALPQPISTKKEKEHKKKKSKTSTTISSDTKPAPEGAGQQTNTGTYSLGSNVSNQTLKKSEEVGIVELVNATDSGGHNGDSNSIVPKGGLGSQTNPLDIISPNANEEFYTVVSLHDGLVVQSTASLQRALGYPKDDWLGRSFIDFINLKDRPTFTEKLANGIVLLYRNRIKGLNKCQTNLFCNLRRYSDPLKIKNEVDSNMKQIRKKQKTINITKTDGITLPYVPFHLSLEFKHFRERRRAEGQKMMLLTITAEPIFSAYKAHEETIISSTFSTRHTASCHFSYVDDDVVQYFGYLPQDMVGRSLFDFYHPEDLPFIKDIYETVVRLDGSSFRSKPYRFAVQNGGYVVLETEWSSFINPWERKLEFIVGHHRVLRGPVNPDVFQPSDEGQRSFLANISEEVYKESQIIQDEIRALLAEKIQTSTGMSTYDLVKQSTELALFMENLMHEVKKPSLTAKMSMIVKKNSPEPGSVILDKISPHHEYCDSKSSSETPPSYNQLNYNEKIERFFNSKPLFKTSGVIELVDATDPGEHNSDSNRITSKNGIISQANCLLNTSSNVNEEFYTVVSLQDGLVLNSTASLQTALGYPKNSWLSCSFLDFVRPQDRATFSDKLACGVILPVGDKKKDLNESQMSLFCNLRRFTDAELENEDVEMETKQNSKKQKSLNANRCHDVNLSYAPFHLSLGFKTFQENVREKNLRMMLLAITAEPVFSAYKAPEETIISSTFSTRHTASCHFSYVDDDVVQYFGYLPQDMVGRSLFDFYHPEDLPFIKDIYETVVRLDGSSFRSKPYRFAVQNGGYVVLETEWSSFINPWERKLEFIVGHHRVLRGPVNPDVFQPSDEGQRSFLANISEEVYKESQIIQDEIRALLAEKIQTSTGMTTYDLVKQSTELALFMENLMHEVKKPSLTSKTPIIIDERSFSERDSVMLGEISPHHEYCNSKSSSETPPSYNQLNYNETMERFFNSKPVLTTVYGSDEEKVQSNVLNNDGSKISPNHPISNQTTLNQDSGGSGSGENLSNDSFNRISSKEDNSNGNSSDPMTIDYSKMPILTETLLNKHNQDMEKLMMLKHKERRSNIKHNKLNKDVKMKANMQEKSTEQGISKIKARSHKRKNSSFHENQYAKVLRRNEKSNNYNKDNILTEARNKTKVKKITTNQSSANINSCPRITFATSYQVTPQTVSTYSAFSQVMPIYYIPVPQAKNHIMNEASHRTMNQPPSPLSNQQESFATSYGHIPLAGVIYPPVIAPTPAPIIYAPPMIVQVPTVQNDNVRKPVPTIHKLAEPKRPASQATSVKAEPGSTMGMSESSKKFFSTGGRFSSCVSIDGGCSSLASLQATNNNTRRYSQIDSSIEDSSDSSFYGSFLNTSSGSSCYPEQIRAANHMSEKIKTRSCKGDTTNRRRFSMVNELKANFESQTIRGNPSATQKIPKKRTAPHFNNENQKETAPIKPPWLQNVKMTPELIYKYQLNPKSLNEVLKADMQTLNKLNQPLLVNDQLDQLYLDLELGGFSTKLILDDSNKSSDCEHTHNQNQSNVSSQLLLAGPGAKRRLPNYPEYFRQNK